jgi:hypothetical protein
MVLIEAGEGICSNGNRNLGLNCLVQTWTPIFAHELKARSDSDPLSEDTSPLPAPSSLVPKEVSEHRRPDTLACV